jgi:hypothetical protein
MFHERLQYAAAAAAAFFDHLMLHAVTMRGCIYVTLQPGNT